MELNRFKQLLESKSGDVKPLLTENEVDESTELWLSSRISKGKGGLHGAERRRREEENERRKGKYQEEVSKYNRDLVLYNFWKNPNLTTNEMNELQDLDKRLSSSDIKGEKQKMLKGYKAEIYLNALKKQLYNDETLDMENDFSRKNRKLEYYGDMLKKLVNNEINIEDIKPIQPELKLEKPSFGDRLGEFLGL